MTVITRPQKQLAGKIRIESTLLVETGLQQARDSRPVDSATIPAGFVDQR
jgi:hypothetical protein